MSIPAELKYTQSHEWARLEADGTVAIGITDHAQELLGDMVFVENPVMGRVLNAGEECAVVESVKAASDVYAPISGEVVAINEELEGSPDLLNKDPYGAWMFKVKPADAGALAGLMDAAAYQAHVDAEAH
ncbi:glycine cleavage system protein GcvH [Parasulfuritortus cantonensis]|uniref:Glycine cleavage system H protein n=1 Tax=Parasulfuritortus cantonensis TaxID=2528202 RepID=A0A4V2NVY8_9PROT|nr:glycine cleavage system protein GcvH [Parasulfuritortus cantonensis]TCJ15342.1 glycine cleavage system protein GcvH [Parasulfuritortus cantonensis]